MKAAALYHLLQIRARKLQEHVPAERSTSLLEIQSSLKVSYQNLSYTLTWRHAGRSYSLELPNKTFSFYVAGDTPHSLIARDDRNYRADNWRQALEVWLRITNLSGLESSDLGAAPELGLTPKSNIPLRKVSDAWLFAPAAAAGALAWMAAGPWAGMWTSVVAGLLVILAGFLSTSHLFRQLSVRESIVISAGPLVPLGFGLDAGWLGVPLAGSAALCWAERLGRRSPWAWMGAGTICGLTIWSGGPDAWASGMLLVLAGVLTAAIAPNKVSAPNAWAFTAGMLLGSITGLYGGASHPIAWAAPLNGTPAALPLAIVTAVCLYCAFLAWWTHGSMFHVMPWFAILGQAALATAAVGGGMPQQAVAVTAMSGFAVFLIARVARVFR